MRRLNEARLAYLEQVVQTLAETERTQVIGAPAPLLARETIGACGTEGATAMCRTSWRPGRPPRPGSAPGGQLVGETA